MNGVSTAFSGGGLHKGPPPCLRLGQARHAGQFTDHHPTHRPNIPTSTLPLPACKRGTPPFSWPICDFCPVTPVSWKCFNGYFRLTTIFRPFRHTHHQRRNTPNMQPARRISEVTARRRAVCRTLKTTICFSSNPPAITHHLFHPADSPYPDRMNDDLPDLTLISSLDLGSPGPPFQGIVVHHGCGAFACCGRGALTQTQPC